MVININRSFINNTGLNESNCLYSLLDNVSPEFENECDIISNSKYCTDVDFQEILQEAHCDICIVNLNCLNFKKNRFEQLKLFLEDFHKYHVLHYNVHALTNILTWHSTHYLYIPSSSSSIRIISS